MKTLEIHKTAKFISLIDVHTGLGPSGVDTLDHRFGSIGDVNDGSHDMEAIFPTEYRDSKVVGAIKDTMESKYIKYVTYTVFLITLLLCLHYNMENDTRYDDRS